MKKTLKIFAILFSVVVVLTFCSCKAKDESSHTSSTPKTEKSSTIIDSQSVDTASETLLRRISAAEDLNTIVSITILSDTDNTAITDKVAMDFLKKYTFSHTREDKRENWDGWLKENSILTLVVDTKTQGEYYLYLMQDGSIAIQVMCGDSEVPDLSYDFYVANKDDMLTKEKLEKF